MTPNSQQPGGMLDLFQTVDTDFSPGDLVGKELHLILDFKFQTVDTDFSPGDFYRN